MSGLAPYRGSWHRTLAAHLLNRAAFGGTPAEIERLTAMGMEKAVDWLVDFEQHEENFPPPTLPENPDSIQELRNLTPEQKQALFRANREAIEEIRGWWINRMLRSPRPLQEKLTLFWHGHFATSANEVKNARHMFNQNELLRRLCAGNFRELLLGISRDPAMLKYLDNNTNRKGRPNENFARELLELFTIGIGHYTEDDVKEAARAFTGWTFEGDTFRFVAAHHDFGPKKFMGRTGNFDGTDIVDIVLEQPQTARFIAAKLFAYFVHDNPAPALVVQLGDALRAMKYEVRPFLRTLFRSEIFYSPAAWRTQIKSPAQLVVGTARLLGVETNPRTLAVAMRMLGQDLLCPPSVKGWEGGEAWINTNTLLMRYNLARYFLTGELPGNPRQMPAGPQRRALRQMLAAAPTNQLNEIVPPEVAVDPDKVVNILVPRLLQAPIEPKVRMWLIEQARTVPAKERAAIVAHLIMSMPDYQLC
ncbi:MAG: DUF1800 domain-containing protein [Verrucomicrobiae bacterium]|nr:DUF1800 domain-containing protein [Verrucomicrobiae bacterium]